MHKLLNIYHQLTDFVNENVGIDLSIGSILGFINLYILSKDNIEFATKIIASIILSLFIVIRIVFTIREDKRKSREAKLKEIEYENENYEFKKRNGLD
jgi:predicted tellurium resistance membrane protein TerC